MTPAELDGYLKGVDDVLSGRWDGDNVIPPSMFMNKESEWYAGYNLAYQEKLKDSNYFLRVTNWNYGEECNELGK